MDLFTSIIICKFSVIGVLRFIYEVVKKDDRFNTFFIKYAKLLIILGWAEFILYMFNQSRALMYTVYIILIINQIKEYRCIIKERRNFK